MKTREQHRLENRAALVAINRGGESIRAYDSAATPCGCVTTDFYGGIDTTVVVLWRDEQRKARLRCMSCDCEWYEPEHPWRGLNPGPQGFVVVRQGVA